MGSGSFLPGHIAGGRASEVTEQLQGLRDAGRVIRGLVATGLQLLGHPPHGRTCQDSAVRSCATEENVSRAAGMTPDTHAAPCRGQLLPGILTLQAGSVRTAPLGQHSEPAPPGQCPQARLLLSQNHCSVSQEKVIFSKSVPSHPLTVLQNQEQNRGCKAPLRHPVGI